MKEILVNPNSDKVITVEGTRVKSLKRYHDNADIEGEKVWTESVHLVTECESIKVTVPAQGRWAPLVNPVTRRPMGLVFKSKTTASIKIFIVAPNYQKRYESDIKTHHGS